MTVYGSKKILGFPSTKLLNLCFIGGGMLGGNINWALSELPGGCLLTVLGAYLENRTVSV